MLFRMWLWWMVETLAKLGFEMGGFNEEMAEVMP